MIRIVLVGQVDGRRQLRGGAIVLAACLAGSISALVAGGGYFLLSGQFSVPATTLRFASGCVVIGSGVIQSGECQSIDCPRCPF